MLIYSICYYHGRNRESNIVKHVKCFQKILYPEKMFSVQVMLDNMEHKEKVLSGLRDIFDTNGVDNYDIIPSFNWGGTVAGLWLAYKKYVSKYNKKSYLAHFEEDFRPTNDKWFQDSIEKLKPGICYVGESNKNKIKRGNDDGRISCPLYKNTKRLGNPEVWLDGGYYFSTLEKFKVIDDHIGIFHKGDQTIKYDHTLDGISLGEVGFPTLCHHAGLKFDFLNRKDYFHHY